MKSLPLPGSKSRNVNRYVNARIAHRLAQEELDRTRAAITLASRSLTGGQMAEADRLWERLKDAVRAGVKVAAPKDEEGAR